MQFSDIPGLDDLKSSLISSFTNNHIAHAQLFNSPLGGAGLPMAIAFAAFLMCEDRTEMDSCGQCPNCQKMAKLIHPDVHFIYPKPSASNSTEYDKLQNESLKKWRQFVVEEPYGDLDSWSHTNGYDNKNLFISREDSRNISRIVSLKSFQGNLKILIIWYPELMHPAAANGILKVLEEPPTQTIYLLVSYNYEGLLATIKSRTQIFNIPRFKDETLINYLMEQKITDDNTAKKIVRISEGSLGRALFELDNIGSVAHESFRKWMLICQKADHSQMVRYVEDFASSSKPEQRNELEYAMSLIRDALLSKVGDQELVFREGPEGEFISKFGAYASMLALERIYLHINQCLLHLQRNANTKITFMNLSLQCSKELRSG